MKKKILIGLIVLIAFGYGFLAGTKKIFPYDTIRLIYNKVLKNNDLNHLNECVNLNEKEIKSLISIKNDKDLNNIRKELIHFVWGNKGIPKRIINNFEKDFKDERYSDIESIDRIDKITVKMDFNLNSYIYHFLPKKSNNKLIIYHQGHGGDFIKSKQQIKYFIDKGFSVIALSMPLLGMNNQPVANIGGKIGKIKLINHLQMAHLTPVEGHNVKYFLEPTIIALNYIKDDYDYDLISMVGISGGGWTTTLVSAIDTRISLSFPVAGSYPIYLRSQRDWGDYEQTIPALYQRINYLELYILASSNNRKQLQIINKFDSCCFAGTKSNSYKDIVSDISSGEFGVLIDDSHSEHKISTFVLNEIVKYIN